MREAKIEIVAWHANEGDHVGMDQPLVPVETDKAVIQIPSPYSGQIARLHGAFGEACRFLRAVIEDLEK